MSPLPPARRHAPSETASRPSSFLPANLLGDAYHRDDGQITTTITVTVTKWYPTPQPTSGVTGYAPGMSGHEMIPSVAELATIRHPTSEIFASPTSSPTSGASSGTSFRSSLVAGTAAGVLVLIAQAALWYILRRRRRRQACAAIRVESHGTSFVPLSPVPDTYIPLLS